MEEETTLKATHDMENNSQSKEIPIDPIQAYCHSCGKNVTTYIKKEFNFYIVLLTILIFYFYGFFYGFFILLITIPLCKNVTHYCPNCMFMLYERQFYPIFKKEKYITLQYGKCLLVVNMLYVIALLSLIIIFGVYLNVVHYTKLVTKSNKDERLENTNDFIDKLVNNSNSEIAWEEFINDCGANLMVENSARAIEIFNRKYYKRTITWKGYFLNAFVQNVRPFEVHSDHLVNLNIRMIPSETLKSQDVVLSMDDIKYKKYLFQLQGLTTGSPILFTGTIESLGDEWKPHHIHMKTIEKTEDFIPPETKVVLFKGINFDISGHLKVQREVTKAKEIEATNKHLLDENITQEVIDENLQDIDLTLDVDDKAKLNITDNIEQLNDTNKNVTSNETIINENKNNNTMNETLSINNTIGNITENNKQLLNTNETVKLVEDENNGDKSSSNETNLINDKTNG